MTQSTLGVNTLYYEIECPRCGKAVRSGIGFRVGAIRQNTYQIGDKLRWEGTVLRPSQRPQGGNIKTIGYFNCDNPRCDTWQDCFPEIQEAVITVQNDVISDVRATTHKPGIQSFDIIDPPGLN